MSSFKFQLECDVLNESCLAPWVVLAISFSHLNHRIEIRPLFFDTVSNNQVFFGLLTPLGICSKAEMLCSSLVGDMDEKSKLLGD